LSIRKNNRQDTEISEADIVKIISLNPISTQVKLGIKQQFKRQKELYFPPLVIVVRGLPQIILSFIFACFQLNRWQQHSLLIAYFLSFAPQLLGFILFVLPSSHYLQEFEATKLSKTILFRWIISKTKNNTMIKEIQKK
jgi:hypothetical protein